MDSCDDLLPLDSGGDELMIVSSCDVSLMVSNGYELLNNNDDDKKPLLFIIK